MRVDTCDVRVGDIVRVEEDQTFPADLLLVGSDQDDGACKIEASNLDGETSLKPRYPPHVSAPFKSIEQLTQFKGVIKCQEPNEQLYNFKGSIQVDGDTEILLSHHNLLLKGSILSSPLIYGVTVFTGKDT